MPFPSLSLYPGPDLYPTLGYRNRFVPPFTVRRIPIAGALTAELQFGLAVMRINGEWVETEFPSAEQEAAADLLFRGGSIYDVDEETAAVLTTAGYTVEIIDE